MASSLTKQYVRVLYDYKYKDSSGTWVNIYKDEECVLEKKATEEWWFVKRQNEARPIYVPATYVEILHKTVITLGGDDDGAKKKKPPKPPVKPKIKPSLEEEVLKELDLILEQAGSSEVFENGRREETNEKSNSSSENLCSKDETVDNKSSDSEPDYENSMILPPNQNPQTQDSARPVSNFYGIDSKKSVKQGSGNLHRKLTKSSSAGSNPDSSGGSKENLLEEKEEPKKLSRYQYELPEYANLPSLGVHVDKKPDELPDYANLTEIRQAYHRRSDPPKPPEGAMPVKTIDEEWDQYMDEESSRPYYYNKKTKATDWKPPRDSKPAKEQEEEKDVKAPPPPSSEKHTLEGSTQSGSDSPVSDKRHTLPPELTPGWSEDKTSGNVFFVNDITNEKWLANKDNSGRVYYYKEDSSESSWSLPETPNSPLPSPSLGSNRNSLDPTKGRPKSGTSPVPSPRTSSKNRMAPSPPQRPSTLMRGTSETANPASLSADSTPATPPMGSSTDPVKTSPDPLLPSPDAEPKSPSNVRELDEELELAVSRERCSLDSLESKPKSPTRITEKKGVLNKTKVAENGKKVRKNWSQSFVVTTGRNLFFYKDQKASQPKSSAPSGKYETVLDLSGAEVEFGGTEISSKKNILVVRTATGTEYLLQCDKDKDAKVINEWQQILSKNIQNLPSTQSSTSLDDDEGSSPYSTSKKKGKKSTSTNSLERPRTPDDGLTGEKKSKIRERLLYWLKKRPPLESLEAKGIYKYTVYGSHLLTISEREKTNVPKFVTRCIRCIDEKGLSSDGLYRISGNLAQIQKLRYAVDDDKYDLDQEEDIHVLTGALKLFFRELREPLIPFNFFDKFIKAIQMQDKAQKLKLIKELIKLLPRVNYDTMKELFAHLTRVLSHSKENRMELQNLAIVFGPTLMWPDKEVINVAVSMVYQGQTVELILHEYRHIFLS